MLIVSGSSDQTVRLWAVGMGTKVFRGHLYTVNAVAITSDASRIVSASDDQTLRVWEVFTGAMAVSGVEPPVDHQSDGANTEHEIATRVRNTSNLFKRTWDWGGAVQKDA